MTTKDVRAPLATSATRFSPLLVQSAIATLDNSATRGCTRLGAK
ncbi:hypothetical protein [Nocardia sp. CY41]|nr:hypothetical protein [Nocardia sp. CY41]